MKEVNEQWITDQCNDIEAVMRTAKEQAGVRPKRSIAEQIFNLRLLIEKHLQHQCVLYHNFIDFKKAFNHVWHEGLWQVMKNFDTNMIVVIKALHEDIRLSSPIFVNIYLENIMQETLHTFISIGG
ncbi:hypothetical protein NP493_546g03153 [Ridgeia piscesae]|uniref:Reverse transcriptase domain-containing protein n=1 Tax=Ridgeia piscesae TaxID=27915 RepID=A0AAD9KVE0_RIDPI|nr:hypothetical protein NP493_546g03153 [Ridgeia piscesae]